MKKKRIILLIKIKVPNKPMKIIEAKKKDGWSNKDIRQFIKGVVNAYPPGAIITTSTISED